MPVSALILDLDGTLVDSNPVHVRAWQRALAGRSYDVPAESLRKHIGMGGDQFVPAVAGADAEAKDGDALRDDHAAAFAALAEHGSIAVFPGARELLAAAKSSGMKTALATSSGPPHLKALAAGAGVDFSELVDATADADDAGASKPDPGLVLAALKKLGVSAGSAALVGDSVYDGEAAGRAGVRFWAVTCGGCFTADELRAAGAEHVYADPAALLAALPGLVAG